MHYVCALIEFAFASGIACAIVLLGLCHLCLGTLEICCAPLLFLCGGWRSASDALVPGTMRVLRGGAYVWFGIALALGPVFRAKPES